MARVQPANISILSQRSSNLSRGLLCRLVYEQVARWEDKFHCQLMRITKAENDEARINV